MQMWLPKNEKPQLIARNKDGWDQFLRCVLEDTNDFWGFFIEGIFIFAP